MKIGVFFALLLASMSISQAQDTSYPIPEETVESEQVASPDYTSPSDDELKQKSILMKDSLAIRNQAYKPKSEKSTEKQAEEESVLSFNFLYYIIQRFKMSEIMDKEK